MKSLSDNNRYLEIQEPLRGEVFDWLQLEANAVQLSQSHALSQGNDQRGLAERQHYNEKALWHIRDILSRIAAGTARDQRVEWFLNNFYILEDQLRKAKHPLSREACKMLPVVKDLKGPCNARVYDIVRTLISHTDGKLDIDIIIHYLAAYQRRTSLKLVELRALPAIFRFALIENIRCTAARIAKMKIGEDPMACGSLQMDATSLRNSVMSLKNIGTGGWNESIDKVNMVDDMLRGDPGGVYPRMDYNTRESYRNVVEKIARYCPLSETEVSGLLIRMTSEERDRAGMDHDNLHVGYYLLGEGLPAILRSTGCRLPLKERIRHLAGKSAPLLYFGLITGITALLGSMLLSYGNRPETGWRWTGMLLLMCALQMAITITDWLSGYIYKGRLIPRMDYTDGIPQENRTLVVIPVLLKSITQCERLIKDLEVHYRGNQDKHLHFALLTDFTDAPAAVMETDNALIDFSRVSIDDLNTKYSSPAGTVFYLFHRPRKYNGQEKIWMGEERKRGKLVDLCRLLRQGDEGPFTFIAGDKKLLPRIKYIITLDADTLLPIGAASKMIAALSHPLNRPVYCNRRRIVTKGYGLLQPRMAVEMKGSRQSIYTEICSGAPGIDTYTRVYADLYQDLFQQGSFVGKGIFDVDIFLKVLDGRFPSNRILSHDLLEGCYVRSGLLADVQLFEGYPVSYRNDVRRRHRWIRGDWQIAAWAMPFVPSADKGRRKNPLSGLSRWKIIDNLRRSLMPISYLSFLLCSWLLAPAPFYGMVIVLITLFLPALLAVGSYLVRQLQSLYRLRRWKGAPSGVGRIFRSCLFALLTLPHEAWYTLDAIVRANVRLYLTRKKMLEWDHMDNTPSAETPVVGSIYLDMWAAPAIGLGVLLTLALFRPFILPDAALFLAAWITAPTIVWWVSIPSTPISNIFSEGEKSYLRRLARTHWCYFENFVGPNDNWLPPDHYQEYPVKRIVHRTSPTNMGISLLAGLAANDFGFLTPGQLLTRSSRTLHTMEQLQRYKGHFYNWYDTQSLKPLSPRYISTVDSGNLAGHLMVFRQGVLELRDKKILDGSLFKGLYDTYCLIKEEIPTALPLVRIHAILEATQHKTDLTLTHIRHSIEELATVAGQLHAALSNDPDTTACWWCGLFLQQTLDIREELLSLTPWVILPRHAKILEALPDIDHIPTLKELKHMEIAVAAAIEKFESSCSDAEQRQLAQYLSVYCCRMTREVNRRWDLIDEISRQCSLFSNIDFSFLYDKYQKLLYTGYNAEADMPDKFYFETLASETRLSAFIGVADNKLPPESWFRLVRPVCHSGGSYNMLSWDGSMFEYLMPLLIMPNYDDTILDIACRTAVKKQMAYGKTHGLPWGISESACNEFNATLHYEYGSRGLASLSLKRSTGDEFTIAPYAAVMALMIMPGEACSNLQALSAAGAESRFGFYEAIEYTPARLPNGKKKEIVYSCMVHHQAMSFLALAYSLLDKPMQRRFLAQPHFQSASLLLHERIAVETVFEKKTQPAPDRRHLPVSGNTAAAGYIMTPLHTRLPQVRLLSNGRYHCMVTNAGGSYSKWNDLDITRWREDTTCDSRGAFCYIRDLDRNIYWSATYQPVLRPADRYETGYTDGEIMFRRYDEDLETSTHITVSPDYDMELRKIIIRNDSAAPKHIEITSYAEVTMATLASDSIHAGFNKLFCKTEILPEHNAILCHRSPGAADGIFPVLYHAMILPDAGNRHISYETDRLKFIGRGNTAMDPLAVKTRGPLTDSRGPVLDPVIAIRCRVTIAPGESARIDLLYGIEKDGDTCAAILQTADNFGFTDRQFEKAAETSRAKAGKLGMDADQLRLFTAMASPVIYAHPSFRPPAGIMSGNRQKQAALWKHAISGDYPIVLLTVNDHAHIDCVELLLKAHAWWRINGLPVDMVILNNDSSDYSRFLQDNIEELVATGPGTDAKGGKGNIYILQTTGVAEEDLLLLKATARLVLNDETPLWSQVLPACLEEEEPVRLPISCCSGITALKDELPDDLIFANGHGGFARLGKEYHIITAAGNPTPMPWSNVLSNPDFGTIVTESGHAHTWACNASEYCLTSRCGDAVCDTPGEAFYLRDEDDGEYWSLTCLPAPDEDSYIVQHGFGYSIFRHQRNGIGTEMKVYADIKQPLKYTIVKISNRSGRPRRLSAFGYAEWVLDSIKAKSSLYIQTNLDETTDAVFAANPHHVHFSERIAFFDIRHPDKTFTTNRTEFLGRNGSLKHPRAMSVPVLSRQTGAGFDACSALQVPLTLNAGEEQELIFILGSGSDVEDARRLIRNGGSATAAAAAYEAVAAYWRRTLGTVHLHTPDLSLDMLMNGWLTYQTISSRLWARTGYYQPGGAFGFRDQLQDVLSILHIDPLLARQHLLLCAAHQFEEGDVLHWWHPGMEWGTRTNCSDDLLWLPFAVCRYITVTGDKKILDEQVPYLFGKLPAIGEEAIYTYFGRHAGTASVYDHCKKAITHSLRFGIHGLPLIGGCDWNDGMNKVGKQGKGESVWLGFFLYTILRQFSKIARQCGDAAFADCCNAHEEQLEINIDRHGWDGAWYRRAYFDDGTPLGSASSNQCRIDSLTQSWSVLSGAAPAERASSAMASAHQHLVDTQNKLVKLLDPPFDMPAPDPGYIGGYVAGVRENGGQYTHAAVWMIMAYAAMGDQRRCRELLEMINPVRHADSPAKARQYKVEPYVVAADVYTAQNQEGRGGWTWYTGAAGWMYQLVLESLVGLTKEGRYLKFNPCLPDSWDSVTILYKYFTGTYHIVVRNPAQSGRTVIMIDDVVQHNNLIELCDDGKLHHVEIGRQNRHIGEYSSLLNSIV